jgi:hypothetical protein
MSSNHVLAQTYTVSPTGGQSDQDVINEALKSDSVVQLQPGIYYLDDYVKIN